MNLQRWVQLLCSGAMFGAAVVGCGASQGGKAAEDTVCKGSAPVPHPFSGVLRNARCDQDMFITMAAVADQMGFACTGCHATKAADPTKEDYPVMTPKKEIANWMSTHLMQAVKPADGSPIRCRSCHVDEKGKPVAKILGEPRNKEKANDWMSEVMVTKFVAADGSKLKCKSCHVGSGPAAADFHKKVILESAQIPKHQVGGKGTQSF